jgi:hypothetical protein
MKKVEMHVPNKSYNGFYGGVAFSNGVGIFTDIAVAEDLANRYGYEIVPVGEEVKVAAAEEVKEVAEKPAPKKRTRKAKAGE